MNLCAWCRRAPHTGLPHGSRSILPSFRRQPRVDFWPKPNANGATLTLIPTAYDKASLLASRLAAGFATQLIRGSRAGVLAVVAQPAYAASLLELPAVSELCEAPPQTSTRSVPTSVGSGASLPAASRCASIRWLPTATVACSYGCGPSCRWVDVDSVRPVVDAEWCAEKSTQNTECSSMLRCPRSAGRAAH